VNSKLVIDEQIAERAAFYQYETFAISSGCGNSPCLVDSSCLGSALRLITPFDIKDNHRVPI
jgi:hypothetical protein